MYKAIIVDDEDIVRSGLKDIIQWEEYGIELIAEASDGSEALEIIRQKKPDIVIIDVKMPVLSGLETIKACVELGCCTKFVVLSGFDHFEYVKKSLIYGVENYLLKPVDTVELSATITLLVSKLDNEYKNLSKNFHDQRVLVDNILNRMISGTINHYDFRERAQILGIDLNGRFEIGIVDAENQDQQGMSEKDRLLVLEISQKHVDAEKGIVFTDAEGLIVILFRYPKELGICFGQTVLADIVSECRRRMKTNVTAAMGNIVPSYKNMNLSYLQAKKTLSYKIEFNSFSVILYSNIEHRRASHLESVQIEYSQLEQLIQRSDRNLLFQYIGNVFDQFRMIESTNPGNIYSITMEIIVILFKTIKDMKGNPYDILNEPYSIANKLMDMTSIEKIQRWIYSMIEKAFVFIELSIDTKYSKVVREMIRQVEQNYSKEISLKTLSEIMFMTPAHLGKIFRDETGQNFSVYLNTYRIRTAEKLLRTTTQKASEIGKMIGLPNTNYFYTIFKKMTGVTPSEYRIKKHRNSWSENTIIEVEDIESKIYN